jgi:hypothetical protein
MKYRTASLHALTGINTRASWGTIATMTNKNKIFLLLALLGVWFIVGANWLMRHGDEGIWFQVYTAGGITLWTAAFVHVLHKIQISEMSAEEYAEYKNKPQPESLM